LNESFNIKQLSEDLFRHESGKMTAVLTKIFGTENLDLSEDVVQETFISAMQIWPLKGIPDNPSASHRFPPVPACGARPRSSADAD